MSHYFKTDKSLESSIKTVKVYIKSQEFNFYTDNGVFSKKGLDYGTRVLLENLNLEKINGDVLDFGCGYGPIGIFVSKNTHANVDMIDINERSISLAIKNARLNKVEPNIFLSDIYQNITKKYDYIITNPPIRVGKKILYQILFGAKNHLKENGELWLVINKNQGAKSLVQDLKEDYDVEVVDKNGGFYVICARNN